MVPAQPANTLTPEEVRYGWKSLSDGKSTVGRRHYRGQGVKAGRRVEDGVLTVADPGDGGDIVTEGQCGWFELKIDVRIPNGQNSGIGHHVAEGDAYPWMSGPEIQIHDDQGQPGQQKTD